jgi:hypothetical protein
VPTTHDLYATPPPSDWSVALTGDARFTWEYGQGRDRMLALYQKGKDKQWDSTTRIDWDLEVDPLDPLGLPDQALAVHGTPYWEKFGPRNQAEARRHFAGWQFSQFLHSEQGAMLTGGKIIASVPDLDSKFYSATQTMDEVRHVEIFSRFLSEKLGLLYPINSGLHQLLLDTLTDSRWDMPYLGMQVLIEGLALAAFGVLRDMSTKPLPKQILTYVMQDEARHVAFGRLALRDYYQQLSAAELAEREAFVIEGCHLMRERVRGQEIWANFGIPPGEVTQMLDDSPYLRALQTLLFSRIVPCVRDIGLWSDRVRNAYAEMGVLDLGKADLEALMRNDEDLADSMDAQRMAAEEAERRAEVDAIIAEAAASD